MDFRGLEGKRVSLVPLREEHAEALYACGRDPAIWPHYPAATAIATMEDAGRFVRKALDMRDKGEHFPFLVFDKELGRAVGSTRFNRISAEHRNLNIGTTWYNPEVWRTRVNTECKMLLLAHAFEAWRAVRVEFVTTTDNELSQRAIERLGAVREGVLRQKYNGMDYVVYSILDREWPDVKRKLQSFLDNDRV